MASLGTLLKSTGGCALSLEFSRLGETDPLPVFFGKLEPSLFALAFVAT